MAFPRPGSDGDHYGPYRGHSLDPRTEPPPEAICQTCGTGREYGPFYESWLSDSSNFEQDDHGRITIHHPTECPTCTPPEPDPDAERLRQKDAAAIAHHTPHKET